MYKGILSNKKIRWFTSRVAAVLGGLALLLCLAPVCFAATLYSNSDGNVADWIEVYDSANNHTLIDAGNYQQIATSSNSNGYARYQYSNSAYGNFYMQVTYVSHYFLGGTNDIEVGVRTNGVETTTQLGYWFKHAIGAGNWSVAGGLSAPSWGTTSINTSCTISDGAVIIITVTGTNAATNVTIAVNSTIYYDVTNPGTVYNTGSFGIGTNTNYSGAYTNWDNYFVEDIAPAETPTFTVTVTPTVTSTPTVTPTLTVTPTMTASPTMTVTPAVNTLTLFDHYYRSGNLDASSPDYSFSGGLWSDVDNEWKTTTVGFGAYGQLVYQPGATKNYTEGKMDLDVIMYPMFYNFTLHPVEVFESGSLLKGWTIRQNDSGALNFQIDATSELGTTITARAWDSAGNTTVVATGYGPGTAEYHTRPNAFDGALTIKDDGNSLTVYWDMWNLGSPAMVTATTKVMEFEFTDYNNGLIHDQVSACFAAGQIYYADYIIVVERYATATPTVTSTFTATPTMTASPTVNVTPETGTSRRIFYYDNKRRKFYQDNKRRTFRYDDRRRKIYKSE